MNATALSELLDQHHDEIPEENVTFGEYYDRVLADPSIAQLSHARLYAMLKEVDPFGSTIFGAEEAIDAFMDFAKSAGARLEIRKRLLLFMGPPGAGKSTMVAALKGGLEEYTRQHPLYAIAECPIREEPLHLLPTSAREALAAKGVYIEGGLCPFCAQQVKPKYANLADVPVRRLSLSEAKRQGIGTFEASDSKNQSNEDLVGAVNLAMLTKYEENDPRAYSFNGEIHVGNRGMLELIEIFKANQELLWTLLSVTQEQQVKMPHMPMCPVDLVLIAHTNEAEFNKFMADQKNEALRDRIVPIRVPYTLSVNDEMKIYRRLLAQRALDDVHVPDVSLKVAAQFAVLTRLKESDLLGTSEENGSGLIAKMKLYNGEEQVGVTKSEVKALHEESPDEGMSGEGPRQIINALSVGLVAQESTCLDPITTLRTLKEMIKDNIQLTAQQQKFYLDRLGIVVDLFVEDSKIEVQKGFTYGFGDAAADTFKRYMVNVGAFLNDEKVENPITGNEEPANERFMREIEEMIGVGENQARAFRTEVFTKMGAALAAGRTFDYASHPKLKEGIEKALFAKLKDAIAVTTGQSNDPKNQQRFNEVVTAMKELGYCSVCAEKLIRFVAERLN